MREVQLGSGKFLAHAKVLSGVVNAVAPRHRLFATCRKVESRVQKAQKSRIPKASIVQLCLPHFSAAKVLCSDSSSPLLLLLHCPLQFSGRLGAEAACYLRCLSASERVFDFTTKQVRWPGRSISLTWLRERLWQPRHCFRKASAKAGCTLQLAAWSVEAVAGKPSGTATACPTTPFPSFSTMASRYGMHIEINNLS